MISRLSAFKYFCLLEHPTPPFLPFFIQACNPIWGLILPIEPWPNDLLTTTGPNWQWHDDIFFFCYSSLCKKLAQQCVDKRLSPRSSDNWLTYHHPRASCRWNSWLKFYIVFFHRRPSSLPLLFPAFFTLNHQIVFWRVSIRVKSKILPESNICLCWHRKAVKWNESSRYQRKHISVAIPAQW